jgi:hypothetical protein
MSEAAQPLDVGIHYGIPAERYHADPAPAPSLSRSVCWTLAKRAAIHGFLEHPRLNPTGKRGPSNAVMDFGELAHAMLLGGEDKIEVEKFKDFKPAAARAWRDRCFAANRIPALQSTFERASTLRLCARAFIDEAGFLADFDAAANEVTVIAQAQKLYIRARFDKLLIDPAGAKDRQHSEIAIAFDVKITGDASPATLPRLIGNQAMISSASFTSRRCLRPRRGLPARHAGSSYSSRISSRIA